MSVSAAIFEAVRARADYACEYCGVTETDAQGLLTIDHFRPISRDGDDDPANLVYACFRCKLITRLAQITASLALGEEDRARFVMEENALLEEQRQILTALWNLEGLPP